MPTKKLLLSFFTTVSRGNLTKNVIARKRRTTAMSSSTYIVTFARDTADDVIDKHIKEAEQSGCTIKHRYNSAMKGYSVEVPDDSVRSLSFNHPNIQSVEADGEVTTQGKSLLNPVIARQGMRHAASFRQLCRCITRHKHIPAATTTATTTTPFATLSQLDSKQPENKLEINSSSFNIDTVLPVQEQLEKLPIIDIGDYVEAFRRSQLGGIVIGQKLISGGLQHLTILLRNGKTVEVKSDSVAFCRKEFIDTTYVTSVIKEPIQLTQLDEQGVLQSYPPTLQQAVQKYQRELSTMKGLAHQTLVQIHKRFIKPDDETEVTLEELASTIFKTDSPTPLQRHVTFLHIVSDNTRFVSTFDVRATDKWILRSEQTSKRISQIVENIRQRDPSYTGFLERMKSLIQFYNTHADPALGTFSQTALEVMPSLSSKITATDKLYINFIAEWIRAPKVITDSPYELFAPIILKGLKCYDDLFFDKQLAIRFLKQIGMFKPYANTSLLEYAPALSEWIWSKKADQNEKILNTFTTTFLSKKDQHKDPYESIRHDFGDLPVYTVDDPSAKEIDDGVSIEKTADGSTWLHVHIADPTTYISPFDELSQTLMRKVQTVYLPERHFPMLPDELASKKFSLGSTAHKNALGSQYALTFSTRLDSKGDLVDFLVRPSYVKNVIKMYYDDVDELIKPLARIPKDPLIDTTKTFSHPSNEVFKDVEKQSVKRKSTVPEHTKQDLLDIYHLSQKHMQHRIANGAIIFQKPQPVLQISPQVLDIPSTEYTTPNYISHLPAIRLRLDTYAFSPARQMVAETMMIGNRVASKFANERSVPIPFRAQMWNPNAPTHAVKLREEMYSMRDPVTGFVKLQDMVHFISVFPPTTVVTEAGLPHVAMGIKDGYTRATSPLRRYMDMVTHWQLKSHLLKEPKTPFSVNQLDILKSRTTAREKQLSLLEASSLQFWVIHLLQRMNYTKEMEWNCIVDNTNRMALTKLGGAMEVATVTLLELGIRGRLVKLNRNVETGEIVKVRISNLNVADGRVDVELL
ncbi:hypothetical protein BDF20DRAFT_831148 [Mycotypha africana]|uniref:uncharacterized protein n=1 Tax=Mycotypha africana TaxID=64632 RepID=UPI002301D867|nr:uncharacterized protein BDF20DRAFT_831148 [Mycotypha africana]KAI8991067.1 hypothetical protein BDF20DRAFT_831148 [Mycotypha africana]